MAPEPIRAVEPLGVTETETAPASGPYRIAEPPPIPEWQVEYERKLQRQLWGEPARAAVTGAAAAALGAFLWSLWPQTGPVAFWFVYSGLFSLAFGLLCGRRPRREDDDGSR